MVAVYMKAGGNQSHLRALSALIRGKESLGCGEEIPDWFNVQHLDLDWWQRLVV